MEESMQFLSRSWSACSTEVSKAVTPRLSLLSKVITKSPTAVAAAGGNHEEPPPSVPANHFCFSSSMASTQLVLERILMPQSMEVSPLTSGRLSYSSGPLNGTDDSPPFSSPVELDDVVKLLNLNDTPQTPSSSCRVGGGGANVSGGSKTVGRWLKERREKKKEETRVQNAQIHAAVSVAGVAAAVAAIASATAASTSCSGTAKKEELTAKMDTAVAAAATLVAAQCVEAAEAAGAEREHLASVVGSAVNINSYGDIMTVTAAAATALRGAATLKARALKEVRSAAAVLPEEKGARLGARVNYNDEDRSYGSGDSGVGDSDRSQKPLLAQNSPSVCNLELLAKGCELLKRTRKGDLHWKIVSVYISTAGQVMLKMKSKRIGRTITKTDKNVVEGVCKEVAAWPGRHMFEGGQQRRYFGLKTEGKRVIEFECKNGDYDLWTQGVSKLLSIVAERKNKN